jgi:SAM-dependent methyltransferase
MADEYLGSAKRRDAGIPSPKGVGQFDLRMSASLVLNGDVRYGRTVNISFDGVDMVFEGSVPFTVNQPIRLGLMTGACILELRGTVENVRQTTGAPGGSHEFPSSGIAVKFEPIASLERQIFGSLLDALRERYLAVNLATLLVAQEAAGDLLLEVGYIGAHRRHQDPFPFASLRSTVPDVQHPALGFREEESGAETVSAAPPPASLEDRAFWEQYLDHFHFIVNVPEYWHLLDRICRLMGERDERSLILDAGCGHANLSQFILIDQAYRNTCQPDSAPYTPHYVGVNFISSALQEAKRKLAERAFEVDLRRPHLSDESTPRSSLCCADMNRPLPFHDNQFDLIVCNLVLAYVWDPLFALREMMRVVAPSGRLILAILKPVADPLQVYRDLLDHLDRAEDQAQVQWMLENWASIQLVEYKAGKRICDSSELEQLFAWSGAVGVRIYPAFADHAFLAVAEKPAY